MRYIMESKKSFFPWKRWLENLSCMIIVFQDSYFDKITFLHISAFLAFIILTEKKIVNAVQGLL